VRYFYDTEFIDNGRTIELISIGVVADDGREYYAVSTEFDPDQAGLWVRSHVLPKLPPPSSLQWRSRAQIRSDLEDFFGVDGLAARPRQRQSPETIELWAWISAYDHVALCQLWGPMTGLPPAMPRFTHELRQLWEDRGSPEMPPRPADAHDALVDARYNRQRFRIISSAERIQT
jgi:3' exoribonuclease, RNase T-like